MKVKNVYLLTKQAHFTVSLWWIQITSITALLLRTTIKQSEDYFSTSTGIPQSIWKPR